MVLGIARKVLVGRVGVTLRLLTTATQGFSQCGDRQLPPNLPPEYPWNATDQESSGKYRQAPVVRS
jgi:hypothetical protein